jgi:hypothetical protein
VLPHLPKIDLILAQSLRDIKGLSNFIRYFIKLLLFYLFYIFIQYQFGIHFELFHLHLVVLLHLCLCSFYMLIRFEFVYIIYINIIFIILFLMEFTIEQFYALFHIEFGQPSLFTGSFILLMLVFFHHSYFC